MAIATLATVALGALTPATAAAATAPTGTPVSLRAASGAGVATPGDFSGYGFDQCLAPGQATMDRWLQTSPFLAVGIYISGDSRACRVQPNLTPTWVATQLAQGWRLLPITLGPQASCLSRFPRYGDDETINPATTSDYAAAKAQGVAEAVKAVGVAQSLGIVGGSTLWYDLEGFDATNTTCRESALSFLGGWTEQVRAQGYVSGVYSSAGSGIQELDRARQTRPTRFTLPDRIWVARWDGVANTSTSYIAEDGWRPGGRVKQYQGGHNETWGGVTINIDSNWLELGRPPAPSARSQCGTQVEFATYAGLRPAAAGKASGPGQVRALQCLLKKKKMYAGKLTGRYQPGLVKAVTSWQRRAGLASSPTWSRKAWQTLLASGTTPVLKIGSTGMAVRRVQRALNTKPGTRGPVDGVYGAATDTAVRAWQTRVGLDASGVVGTDDWAALVAGRR
ncbi:MAG: DUF1906 domain-containing protein [Nocardioides sp.]|nr:DUF1906 domain-containing protein [Nocardioides sp.]